MIIAFANQKGGVAKTTTCVNLGAGLALRGHSVLLVDADPQGSLSRYLGAAPGPSLGDLLLKRRAAEDVLRASGFAGLSYIAAAEELVADQANIEQDRIKAIHYLRKALEPLRQRFDFILIDTMPSFTTLFANSLVAADKLIIPVKLEWLSVQGLAPLISKVRDVQTDIKDIEILGILGTFAREGVTESQNCLDELRANAAGVPVFSTAIHLNSKLAEACGSGKPIQHYDRHCRGFEDYEGFVGEVLARCGAKSKLPAAAKAAEAA